MQKNSSSSYSQFYGESGKISKSPPESFVARAFLSKKPVEFLRNYIFKDKCILDMGCGEGRHSRFLESLGFNVFATEVSAEHITKISSVYPTIKFFEGKSTCLPFADNKFDSVLCANSIYYLDGKEAIGDVLNELRRVLKQDGFIVGSFINEDHFALKNCKVLSDKSVILTSDPLSFRNGIRIRPLWFNESLSAILKSSGFFLHKSSHLVDNCEGFKRSLTYFSAYKN